MSVGAKFENIEIPVENIESPVEVVESFIEVVESPTLSKKEQKAKEVAEKKEKRHQDKLKKIEEDSKRKIEILQKKKEADLLIKKEEDNNNEIVHFNTSNISIKPIGKSKTFKEAFGTDKMIEEFDRRKTKHILNNWDLYAPKFTVYDNEDNIKYDPKEILESYVKKSRGLNYNFVKYKKSINSKKYGRWFAEKSLSIQNMPRVIRHTICKDLWIDLDFKNCHPVILEQLCIFYGVSCEYLHKYNTNREEMLKEITDKTGCSRDDAKKFVLKTLNGSKVNINIEWWNLLKQEFINIADKIASRDEFKKIKKDCLSIRQDNINARVMNCVLCIYENMCLENLYEFLSDNGVIQGFKCCLIFDGLQVVKSPHNINKITTEFLNDASTYIKQKTGLSLELTTKDFDEFIDITINENDKDTYLIENGDDMSACEYILSLHNNKLKKCKGQVFIYDDGIWSSNDKVINDVLTSLICNEDIRKKLENGTSPYSRCAKSIENCKKLILASNKYIDDDFVEKIFKSNLYYLAFKDGVWSFKENKFLPYPINDREIFFTTKINRNFPKNTNTYINENNIKISYEDAIKAVYDKIINPILPDKHQQAYFLHILARGLAGHFEDKKWYVGQGLRDCGKGVLCLMLKLAFKGFVGVVKSENFLVKRLGDGDNAKKMSWLIPLEFVRLAISNEISFIENVSKIDGNIIKSFASGGDLQQARQNYKDEREFQIQSTFIAMCNDFPRIEPEDAYETLEAFIFKNKFVDASLIVDGCPDFYQVKDEDVKGWCKSDYVIDAFTMIILNHYEVRRMKPDTSIIKDIEMFKGDIKEPLDKVITKYLKHSNNKNDRLHTTDIVKHLSKYGVEETPNKITSMLKLLRIGCYDKFKIGNRNSSGFTNIIIVDVDEKINDDDDNDDTSNTNKRLPFIEEDNVPPSLITPIKKKK